MSPTAASQSERTAFVYVDLGWLRHRSKSIYGSEKPIRPGGLQEILTRATSTRGPIASTGRRVYVYDAAPEDDPSSTSPRGADQYGEPAPHLSTHQLTKNHEALRAGELLHLQLGRLVRTGGKWQQKGVDTLLVADTLEAAYRGVCQVAHVLANDTDYVDVLKRVRSLGTQIVLYEFAESAEREQLHPLLRDVADRVELIDVNQASRLYGQLLRYRVWGAKPPWAPKQLEVIDILHGHDFRMSVSGDEFDLAVEFGDPKDETKRRAVEKQVTYLCLAAAAKDRWEMHVKPVGERSTLTNEWVEPGDLASVLAPYLQR